MRIYDALVQFFALLVLLACAGVVFCEEDLCKQEAEMAYWGVPEYVWVQVDTLTTDANTGFRLLDPRVSLYSRFAFVHEFGELTLHDLLVYKRRGVFKKEKLFVRYDL